MFGSKGPETIANLQFETSTMSSDSLRSTSNYTQRFATPIYLKPVSDGREYYVGLYAARNFFSNPNVSAAYMNNKFKILVAGVWQTLTLPDGTFNLDQIQSFISETGIQAGWWADNDHCGVLLEWNPAYSRVTCKFYNTTYGLDVTEASSGDFYDLLGFIPQIMLGSTSLTHIAENSPNMNFQSHLLLTCDLVEASYLNGVSAPILAVIDEDVPPGTLVITKAAPEIVWCKIRGVSTISSITIQWLDMYGNVVDFKQMETSVSLLIQLR